MKGVCVYVICLRVLTDVRWCGCGWPKLTTRDALLSPRRPKEAAKKERQGETGERVLGPTRALLVQDTSFRVCV